MSQGFCTAYTPGPEPVKLSELRAKTDQQLLNLIDSTLDVGLNFAVLAEVEANTGDRAYSEQSLGLADQALVEVQRLLPALNEEHRRELDPKVNELRAVLECLGRHREVSRTQTASMS